MKIRELLVTYTVTGDLNIVIVTDDEAQHRLTPARNRVIMYDPDTEHEMKPFLLIPLENEE